MSYISGQCHTVFQSDGLIISPAGRRVPLVPYLCQHLPCRSYLHSLGVCVALFTFPCLLSRARFSCSLIFWVSSYVSCLKYIAHSRTDFLDFFFFNIDFQKLYFPIGKLHSLIPMIPLPLVLHVTLVPPPLLLWVPHTYRLPLNMDPCLS